MEDHVEGEGVLLRSESSPLQRRENYDDDDDDGTGRHELPRHSGNGEGASSVLGKDPLWSLLSAWSLCSNPSGCYLSTGEDGESVRGLRTSVQLGPGDDVLILPWNRVLGMRAACNLLVAEHDAGRGVLIRAESLTSRGKSGENNVDGAEALRWLVGTVRSVCAGAAPRGGDSIRHGSSEPRYDSDSDSDSDGSFGDGCGVPNDSADSTDSPAHVVWSAIMACALLSVSQQHRSRWSSSWGAYVASLPPPPPLLGGDRCGEVANASRRGCRDAMREVPARDRGRDDSDSTAHAKDPRTMGNDRGMRCWDEPLCGGKGEESEEQETHGDYMYDDNSVDGGECLRHVLLWSEAELNATGDDELVTTVKADWDRMRRVWEALFVVQGEGFVPPVVEYKSWLWAHAILRSRVVGMPEAPLGVTTYLVKPPPAGSEGHNVLNGERDGRFLLQGQGVLLPVIDMINHCSSSPRAENSRIIARSGPVDLAQAAANAHLALRPAGVAVVSTDPVPPHSELFFDYHPTATMRNTFRGYGFVDFSSSSGRIRQTFRPRGCPRVGLDVMCSRHALTSEKGGGGGKTSEMLRAVCIRPDVKTGGVLIVVCDGEVAWGSLDTFKISGADSSVSDGGVDDELCGSNEDEELDRLPDVDARSIQPQPWPEPLNLLGDSDSCGSLPSPLDEGQLCGAGAACARLVLESVGTYDTDELSSLAPGADDENIKLAEEYRAANTALLRRCLHDLGTLSAAFGG